MRPPSVRTLAAHLAVALLLVALLTAPDYLYRILEPHYRGALSASSARWLVLIAILMVGLRRRLTALTVLGLFALLQLSQLYHFAYYGTQFSPFEVALLFSEADEVWASLSAIIGHLVWPTVVVACCAGAAAALWVGARRYTVAIAPAALLLAGLLCVLPYRGYHARDAQAFFPNPAALALTNSIYAVSYAIGQQFKPQRGIKVAYLPYVVRSVATDDLPNVIVVMGESLTWRHMGLFGYPRPTTPRLATLRDDPSFVAKRALAGGVATKVSLPQFFNVQREPGNLRHLVRYESNLLKLAREHGYATQFISAQTANLMTYAGVEFADRFLPKDHMSATQLAAKDDVLLEQLRAIDLSRPSFVVLHQRNSHGPYDESYPPEYARWPIAGVSYADYVRNAYDNSITYTDALLTRLIDYLQTHAQRPTYFVFTADHGELVGEEGRYGHGFLAPRVLEVPFLFYAVRGVPSVLERVRALDTPTHYEIAQLVAGLLGYAVDNPNATAAPERFYATGSDVAGGMGCLALEKDRSTVEGWRPVADPICAR